MTTLAFNPNHHCQPQGTFPVGQAGLLASIIVNKRTNTVVAKLRRLLAKEKRRQRKLAHTLANLREQVTLLEIELQDSLCRDERLTAQLVAVEGGQ